MDYWPAAAVRSDLGCIGNGLRLAATIRFLEAGSCFGRHLDKMNRHVQALERWSKQSLELLRDCRRPLSLLAEHLVSIWVWPRRVIPKLYSLCLFIVEDLLAEQEA